MVFEKLKDIILDQLDVDEDEITMEEAEYACRMYRQTT